MPIRCVSIELVEKLTLARDSEQDDTALFLNIRLDQVLD